MCFSGEPNTKYYYHEEVIPARRHKHHHGHHHGHGHSPRASYTSVTRQHYYSGSPRTSTTYYRPAAPGAAVYERTSQARH
ncbi:Uncharacterized protein TCAP_07354 [Tolypocladium capitatum]|uniref:Uncharacterized protein n=1 Tax=Tolypocladium capitatum TaxID=45235 RepID=A0A2K3PZC9_9HYPO|nr:Uncharacterized protein TCAP_07354 [Tolypocladium capitatum]